MTNMLIAQPLLKFSRLEIMWSSTVYASKQTELSSNKVKLTV